jgi:hypothetical protein
MKKSRKERDKELRDDGFVKIGGVDFSNISDRQVGDPRFERERAYRLKAQEEGVSNQKSGQSAASATFDGFIRIAAGTESMS